MTEGRSVLSGVKGVLRKVVRRAWMKRALQGTSASDNFSQLDRAYRLADPWNMESALEQARFQATAALLERNFGRVPRLLEIGCGEGHQSRALAPWCEQLYGIDVSPIAIARAKQRMPQGQFAACDLFTRPWGDDHEPYDLVTACEVLYYMRDIPRVLHEMSRISRACLVTFFAPAARRVAPHLTEIVGLQQGWFYHGSTVWLACWWSNRRD